MITSEELMQLANDKELSIGAAWNALSEAADAIDQLKQHNAEAEAALWLVSKGWVTQLEDGYGCELDSSSQGSLYVVEAKTLTELAELVKNEVEK